MVVADESYRGEDASDDLSEYPCPHDAEAEETLSLCDLPIYSDESNRDDYYKQDYSASFDNDGDNFFEFSSDDFSVSNSAYSGSDNIIFCGKLIPYKQPSDSQNTGRIASDKISAKNCQFRTKSHSFNNKKPSAIDARGARTRGGKCFDSFSISLPKNPEYIERKRSRKLDKYDFPAERAMILESSTTKSRWFLFLFGSARFPKEMELSDMRTRQRRSSPPTMFRPSEERKVARGSGGKKTTAHGLWKLLRALIGCRSSDRNVAVKGSFSPIPVA